MDSAALASLCESGVIILLASVVSVCSLLLIEPLLRRFVLAHPNARSSHTKVTPQGAGIGLVISITIVTAIVAWSGKAGPLQGHQLVWLFVATIIASIVGVIADMYPLGVLSRLLVQAVAVAIVVGPASAQIHVLKIAPVWLDKVLLLVALLWFVNLVNFMDGIDWMTVAEVVPVAGALVIFGLFKILPADAYVVALVLLGAILGFAPFNRPVARLFLGDAGSLPIGMLLGWLLLVLADQGYFAAAVLLPLYYVADSTLTLFLRILRGEYVWQAHRTHHYQQASDNGHTVYAITGRVFIVNLALAFLAAWTIYANSKLVDILAVMLGIALVLTLLRTFVRPGNPWL